MTSEKVLVLNVRQLRVAFEVMLKAYQEFHRTGQVEERQLAAAALTDIESMVTSLSIAGLDRAGYDGSHVNELLRRGEALDSPEGNGEEAT